MGFTTSCAGAWRTSSSCRASTIPSSSQRDGHLNEALLRQYLDFHLTRPSDLTRVSTAEEALEAVGGNLRFDLVITTPHPAGMDVGEFARRVRETGTEAPVVLLAFSSGELAEFVAASDSSAIDRVYLWQGDARILLAIVKQTEDRMNAPRDTGLVGVPVILVVEDDPRYWSSFLPVIYSELLRHTRSLLAEGLNISEKLLRVRARPKVLLCESFEEGF